MKPASFFYNKNFWIINISNLLVCTALYMLCPTTPFYFSSNSSGLICLGPVAYILFALGTIVLAPFCNYWLDTFRRKNVMLIALLGVLFVMLLLPFSTKGMQLILRTLQGCAYGVFQISLGSTLLLDLADSKERTKVAHIYYWIHRMSLVLGAISGWYIMNSFSIEDGVYVLQGMLVVALFLLLLLIVPFRAPLEPKIFSLDRFWLNRGKILAFPLFLTMLAAGVFLSQQRPIEFYVLMLVGYLISLLLHIFFFKNNISTEIICGLLLLIGANIQDWLVVNSEMNSLVGLFFGVGIGAFSSRYLLSYIRICSHCERGTAQTSYWLCWDLGVALGCSLGLLLLEDIYKVTCSLIILVFVFLYYLFFQRTWYVKHKRK